MKSENLKISLCRRKPEQHNNVLRPQFRFYITCTIPKETYIPSSVCVECYKYLSVNGFLLKTILGLYTSRKTFNPVCIHIHTVCHSFWDGCFSLWMCTYHTYTLLFTYIHLISTLQMYLLGLCYYSLAGLTFQDQPLLLVEAYST